MAVVLIQLFALIPTVKAKYSPGEKRMLMVSAYYSPQPGQSFYMRGSYEADKRLNGRGTNGADGTPVYIGMLAAPRTYPFGTRISIPGLGVGEVHDRGGAILARNNYDRIDVWMGKGEDGLSRALNWGMRLVEGEVYFNAYEVEPGLDFGWVSSTLPSGTLNRLKAKTLINPDIFTKPITKSSSTTSIKELQEALRLFGYYHDEVDGVFDNSTKEALMAFQIAEGVIPNANAVGAGYFGPKTQEALKTKSENFNSRVLKEQKRLQENVESITAGLGKKATGEKVYNLQQMLWELGYYRGELNGNYDAVTIDAVLEFQKDHGVVQNDWEQGAGYFGKKTHEALVAAVDKRAEKIAEYPVEMQVWVPAKVELPKLSSFDENIEVTERPELNFNADFPKGEVIATKDFFQFDIELNDRGKDVVSLQNILVKEGYLTSGLNTGYFGAATKNALIKLQIDKGVIKNTSDTGAGRVGPKTRALLNTL